MCVCVEARVDKVTDDTPVNQVLSHKYTVMLSLGLGLGLGLGLEPCGLANNVIPANS